MDKKRLEKIKENVYTRCSIATTTGIGMTAPDKEEIELLDEIERLNNIIKNTAVELEILLQSEDFKLITMQLKNIVFRLKGSE